MTLLRLNLNHLNDMLDELGDQLEAAARPASQAAAQVLYEQVRSNVATLPQQSGNLLSSIYQQYSKLSGPGLAIYHISWNKQKAPHGHLVEFGHIQRYASYIGKDGKWHTAIRKGARGKPKPKRNAPQSEKDAYYVPLPAPKQVAAKSFLRKAASAAGEAADAAEQVLLRALHDDA
jgi:hypothetical protein